MDISNRVNRAQDIKTVNTAKAAPAATSDKVSTPDLKQQVRNISFKLNKDDNEVYVEITNEDDEVVRTIPADENDPKFIELIKQSSPGMVIDKKG